MANRNRTVSAISLSKLPTMLLRKLSEAVKKDGAAGDRTTRQIQAAYERQEAELVRSLERTRRVLALLRTSRRPRGTSEIRPFQCAARLPRRQKISGESVRVVGVFELLLARDRSHEVNLITVSIAALVGGSMIDILSIPLDAQWIRTC